MILHRHHIDYHEPVTKVVQIDKFIVCKEMEVEMEVVGGE